MTSYHPSPPPLERTRSDSEETCVPARHDDPILSPLPEHEQSRANTPHSFKSWPNTDLLSDVSSSNFHSRTSSLQGDYVERETSQERFIMPSLSIDTAVQPHTEPFDLKVCVIGAAEQCHELMSLLQSELSRLAEPSIRVSIHSKEIVGDVHTELDNSFSILHSVFSTDLPLMSSSVIDTALEGAWIALNQSHLIVLLQPSIDDQLCSELQVDWHLLSQYLPCLLYSPCENQAVQERSFAEAMHESRPVSNTQDLVHLLQTARSVCRSTISSRFLTWRSHQRETHPLSSLFSATDASIYTVHDDYAVADVSDLTALDPLHDIDVVCKSAWHYLRPLRLVLMRVASFATLSAGLASLTFLLGGLLVS